MNLPEGTGPVAALVGSGVSAIVILVTAFGWVQLTPDQQTVVISAATFFTGLGVLVYSALHAWQSQSYDIAQVTSLLETAAGYVFALLSAFGALHASQAQQAAVTGVCGVLGTLGLFVFGAIHVKQQVEIQKLGGKRA